MNRDIYLQIDGVAMGSPLRPVLDRIFMVELKRSIVAKLSITLNFGRVLLMTLSHFQIWNLLITF